jgi:hypothetical protein
MTSRAEFCLAQNGIAGRFDAKFCASDDAVANHFSLIRSFLIDSGHSQARATRFVQNIFAQHLRCTRSINVAKFFALMVGKCRRASRKAKIRGCKKALFHRTFFDSAAMRKLKARCRERSVFVSVNDVVLCMHDVLRDAAIHIVMCCQCFFHCSVVNRMKYASIRDRTEMRHPPCYMARRAANG